MTETHVIRIFETDFDTICGLGNVKDTPASVMNRVLKEYLEDQERKSISRIYREGK